MIKNNNLDWLNETNSKFNVTGDNGQEKISLKKFSKFVDDNFLYLFDKELQTKLIEYFKRNGINIYEFNNFEWGSEGAANIDSCICLGYDDCGEDLFVYAYCEKCGKESTAEKTSGDFLLLMSNISEMYQWIEEHINNFHGDH